MKKDPRPDVYRYWRQLMTHLGGDTDVFYNRELIWPRQFEIHLPADHKRPCDLGCPHCAGRKFDRSLGTWEREGLELLDRLEGAIPFHIYGGAYTEPLNNPYYLAFLNMTKKYGNHFGIHTNGVLLNFLEEYRGWLTELNRLSTDGIDYLSVSIDAGLHWSWGMTKGTKQVEKFHWIVEGLRKACEIREANGGGHAIRMCYLVSPHSMDRENFLAIASIARSLGVDSLRFSIPFANYNQDFVKVREYKNEVELPGDDVCRELLEDIVSEDESEHPYIFYTGPEFTDVDKFDFDKCVYGYYQITYGADGYAYKCSTTATPTAKHCRIGKVTADLEEFKRMILRNYNPDWNCQGQCFDCGVRCNRMGLEINRAFMELCDEQEGVQ